MESAGTLEIWARSVSKNQLAYTNYIGDGDSSSFKRLSESNPYDSLELVRKEECLGHMQKRLKGQLKILAPNNWYRNPLDLLSLSESRISIGWLLYRTGKETQFDR